VISRHRSMRKPAVFVLSLAAIAGTIATALPSGVANADVCATANGQRVYASGCVDVAGAVDYYAPPPAYYAPLPQDFDPLPNVTACVGATGRRGHVTVSGCT
jgi:hypothetical protein